MTLDLIVFGSISAVLTAGMIFYTYRTYSHFRENDELAATKLAIKDGVPGAFKALSAASFLFSVLALAGVISLALGEGSFQYLSEVGGFIMMIGFIYFQKKVSEFTRREESTSS